MPRESRRAVFVAGDFVHEQFLSPHGALFESPGGYFSHYTGGQSARCKVVFLY